MLDWVFGSTRRRAKSLFPRDAEAEKEAPSYFRAKKGAAGLMNMSVPHSSVQKIRVQRGKAKTVLAILYRS